MLIQGPTYIILINISKIRILYDAFLRNIHIFCNSDAGMRHVCLWLDLILAAEGDHEWSQVVARNLS